MTPEKKIKIVFQNLKNMSLELANIRKANTLKALFKECKISQKQICKTIFSQKGYQYPWFNLASFPEKKKKNRKNYISKFTCYYILCLLCRKSYLLDFIALPLRLLNLVTMQFDKAKLYLNASKRVIFEGLVYWVISY